MSKRSFYSITQSINILVCAAILKSKEESMQENTFFQKTYIMDGFLYINLSGWLFCGVVGPLLSHLAE